MANSLNTNPIILDTAGATSVIQKEVRIKKVVWSGDAIAATNDLKIDQLNNMKAEAGDGFIEATAQINDQTLQFDFPNIFVAKGLILSTMTSNNGKVFIYT